MSQVQSGGVSHDRQRDYAPVRRVLWTVLFANLAVTAVKLTLGFMTGALAVIADGFHSLVDSSSNLVGLAAIRLAGRPADDRHPYGYSRYEAVGTFAIGGMLLVAAYEVGRAIVERLISGGGPAFTPLTFWMVILTFPVNLLIFFLERRAGKRLNSQVLLADSAHTRTDLYITASVIASLVGVRYGMPWLDLIVAGFVVVLILRAAVEILRSAASTLADRIVLDAEQIERIAMEVPGVRFVHQVRSRGAPGYGFVDLHVKVHSGMSTEQAHAIATEVERRLGRDLPEISEALVHIEPALQMPTLMDRVRYDLRQIADGMGLGTHDLHVHAADDGTYTVELHLEVPGKMSLREAHDLSEEFEARVSESASRPFKLITHLEPIPDEVLHPDPVDTPRLRERIHAQVVDQIGESRLRDLQIYRIGTRIGVSAKVSVPPETSLASAHSLSETIERELLNAFPEIHRVTVHVEPGDADG